MTSRWQNHTVVVLGAAGGIGGAIVEEARSQGACVRGGDIRPSLHTDLVDVTDLDQIHSWVIGCRPDVVVMAAGLAFSGPLLLTEDADIYRVLAVNTVGTLNLLQAAQFAFDALDTRGRFVHINSAFAEVTAPGFGVYSASKAASALLLASAHQEFQPSSITDVFLGGVKTPIFDRARSSAGETAAQLTAERFNRSIARATAASAAKRILSAAWVRRRQAHIGLDATLLSSARRLAPALTTHFLERKIRQQRTDDECP